MGHRTKIYLGDADVTKFISGIKLSISPNELVEVHLTIPTIHGLELNIEGQTILEMLEIEGVGYDELDRRTEKAREGESMI